MQIEYCRWWLRREAGEHLDFEGDGHTHLTVDDLTGVWVRLCGSWADGWARPSVVVYWSGLLGM